MPATHTSKANILPFFSMLQNRHQNKHMDAMKKK